MPPSGFMRSYSITADIFHFVNCDVSDSLDDAVYVNGVYTRVQTAGEDKLMLMLGHQEQYGLNPYRRGDRVRVTAADGAVQEWANDPYDPQPHAAPDGVLTVEAAAALGVGSREYELVEL